MTPRRKFFALAISYILRPPTPSPLENSGTAPDSPFLMYGEWYIKLGDCDKRTHSRSVSQLSYMPFYPRSDSTHGPSSSSLVLFGVKVLTKTKSCIYHWQCLGQVSLTFTIDSILPRNDTIVAEVGTRVVGVVWVVVIGVFFIHCSCSSSRKYSSSSSSSCCCCSSRGSSSGSTIIGSCSSSSSSS